MTYGKKMPGSTTRLLSMKSLSLRLLLLLPHPSFVNGSIQSIATVLYPMEEVVQYTDSYIRSPGTIDLSQLAFKAISAPYIEVYGGPSTDDATEGFDDFVAQEEQNNGTGGGHADDDTGSGGGGNRMLSNQRRAQIGHLAQFTNRFMESTTNSSSASKSGNTTVDTPKINTTVDVLIFPLSTKCQKDESNCDWASLGVGKMTKGIDGAELRWCCDKQQADDGICNADDDGTLIVDHDVFKGKHIKIEVPYEGNMNITTEDNPEFQFDVENSATYVVMFGNCNPIFGREVSVDGSITFASKHGYLPGELYGFMYFYFVSTIIYIMLYFWYAGLMRYYTEHRIPIEKWILLTISLGCAEMVFRSFDYMIWNGRGHRSMPIVWTSFAAGILKQGFSRCLLVMVSMGWGVIRDSLGRSMPIIIILGVSYIVVLTILDALILVAADSMSEATISKEKKLLSTVTLLNALKYSIDVIFVVWIADSLRKTLDYLGSQKNQHKKLQRLKSLLYILICSVTFATISALISLIDVSKEESMFQEQFAWLKDAMSEINYLFVLVSIAILWRPSPNAREYAYAMELGTTDDDNDLELSQIDVPSAIDDDTYSNGRHNSHIIT